MPKNGEVNSQFGIYRNVCCGIEIVVPAGLTFPDCRNHVRLPTEWKLIEKDERIPHTSELKDGKKPR